MKVLYKFFGAAAWAVAGALLSANILSGCASTPEITPEAAIPEPPVPVIEEENPLPEAPERTEPRTVVYTVEPTPRVEDTLGYVEIEYIEAAGEEKPRIAVGIGRKDIEHADTEGYVFSFVIDGRSYTMEGRHSVPFVRGKDGLWWNVAEVRLPFSFSEELSLVVTDQYARKEYRFRVKRTFE